MVVLGLLNVSIVVARQVAMPRGITRRVAGPSSYNRAPSLRSLSLCHAVDMFRWYALHASIFGGEEVALHGFLLLFLWVVGWGPPLLFGAVCLWLR